MVTVIRQLILSSPSDTPGASLTAAGQARFNLASLAPGTYLCNILYPGDVNHTSVTSSTFTFQVTPAGTTTTLSYYIYLQGFERMYLGYGSAVAWTLFLLVFGLTLLQWCRRSRDSAD